LFVGSALSYLLQKNKWQNVADHCIRAAYENLGPSAGGGRESAEVRREALAEIEEEDNRAMEGKSGREKKAAKRMMQAAAAGGGASGERTKAQERLYKLIVKKVNQIDDFGGGFHKPSLRDLMVVRILKVPLEIYRTLYWKCRISYRRRRKIEYNDDDVLYLTKKAVGVIGWDAETPEQQKIMLTLKLWIPENLERLKEEIELSRMGRGARKQAKRDKKKAGWKDDQYVEGEN